MKCICGNSEFLHTDVYFQLSKNWYEAYVCSKCGIFKVNLETVIDNVKKDSKTRKLPGGGEKVK